jgi:hypothetical protein
MAFNVIATKVQLAEKESLTHIGVLAHKIKKNRRVLLLPEYLIHLKARIKKTLDKLM